MAEVVDHLPRPTQGLPGSYGVNMEIESHGISTVPHGKRQGFHFVRDKSYHG